MISAEQELEKLKKQRAELVEWLGEREKEIAESYSSGYISATYAALALSGIVDTKKFIAKQGGE